MQIQAVAVTTAAAIAVFAAGCFVGASISGNDLTVASELKALNQHFERGGIERSINLVDISLGQVVRELENNTAAVQGVEFTINRKGK